MTTSAPKSRMLGSSKKTDISVGELAFEREYFRNLVFQEIILAFNKASSEEGLTRSELARRIRRAPEQITRWLSAPGNMELDSLSDLLTAMGTRPESILRSHEHQTPTREVTDLLSKLADRPRKLHSAFSEIQNPDAERNLRSLLEHWARETYADDRKPTEERAWIGSRNLNTLGGLETLEKNRHRNSASDKMVPA